MTGSSAPDDVDVSERRFQVLALDDAQPCQPRARHGDQRLDVPHTGGLQAREVCLEREGQAGRLDHQLDVEPYGRRALPGRRS